MACRRDERLEYNASGGMTQLSLDWKILTDIWKPDTVFVNGMTSKLHRITVPNRFSRLTPDGTISYSQRLTVHAGCAMDLVKFPLDSQVCPLLIGSFGYPAAEIQFQWQDPVGSPIKKIILATFFFYLSHQPVEIGDIQMSQFLYIKSSNGVETKVSNRKLEAGLRNDSIAYLHLYFERQTGYFILQIYTPLLLMVFCSWVAFWIVRTDVPSRCGLGVTTVLSVAKIGFVGGAGKPQVPYATALDTFVIICFLSVFASLIEVGRQSGVSFLLAVISVWKNRRETKIISAPTDSCRVLSIPSSCSCCKCRSWSASLSGWGSSRCWTNRPCPAAAGTRPKPPPRRRTRWRSSLPWPEKISMFFQCFIN